MVSNTKFDSSLTLGKKAERRYAEVLKERYGDNLLDLKFAPDKTFKDRDIKIKVLEDGKECTKTYEIKSDTRSGDTGNFVIEFYSWGEPSGIARTKADYWAHYTLPSKYFSEGGWWEQETKELKRRLKSKKRYSVNGGNGSASRMLRIPCKELPLIFNKVDTDIKGGELEEEVLSEEIMPC